MVVVVSFLLNKEKKNLTISSRIHFFFLHKEKYILKTNCNCNSKVLIFWPITVYFTKQIGRVRVF